MRMKTWVSVTLLAALAAICLSGCYGTYYPGSSTQEDRQSTSTAK